MKNFIKPKAPVFNPNTGRPLNQKGQWVKWSAYWERRLREGVIRLVKGPLFKKMEEAKKVANQKKETATVEQLKETATAE